MRDGIHIWTEETRSKTYTTGHIIIWLREGTLWYLVSKLLLLWHWGSLRDFRRKRGFFEGCFDFLHFNFLLLWGFWRRSSHRFKLFRRQSFFRLHFKGWPLFSFLTLFWILHLILLSFLFLDCLKRISYLVLRHFWSILIHSRAVNLLYLLIMLNKSLFGLFILNREHLFFLSPPTLHVNYLRFLFRYISGSRCLSLLQFQQILTFLHWYVILCLRNLLLSWLFFLFLTILLTFLVPFLLLIDWWVFHF